MNDSMQAHPHCHARMQEEIDKLRAENFALAAGQCIVKDGLLGDEHGHQYCALQRAQQPQAGKMHEADRAFYDLIVAQRNRAWCDAEQLSLKLSDLTKSASEPLIVHVIRMNDAIAHVMTGDLGAATAKMNRLKAAYFYRNHENMGWKTREEYESSVHWCIEDFEAEQIKSS